MGIITRGKNFPMIVKILLGYGS